MHSEVLRDFLHSAHIFASAVQDVLGERYLRQTTRFDISVPQMELLRLIRLGGDHQIRDFAAFLGVSSAAASKNVDKLVRLGLVNRTVQDRDRRAVSLDLSGRGRSLVAKYEEHKQDRLRAAIGQMPAGDVSALARGLEQISFLILKNEDAGSDLCIRCSVYYAADCPLQGLSDGCIYAKTLASRTPAPVGGVGPHVE